MNHINLNMKSAEVKTEVREIRASWTREMALEVASYHGMNLNIEELIFRPERRKGSINKIFKTSL